MSMFSMPTSVSEFIIQSIKTLPYLAVTLGPLFFCIGLWMNSSSGSFSRNAISVDALVTTVEERRSEKAMVYRPTFETGHNGQTVQYVGNTWVAPKPHEAGDIVSAYYDQASGEIRSKVMLDQLQFLGAMFMRSGAILTLLGTAFLVWRRYAHHQQP